jgi:hypothetical protein
MGDAVGGVRLPRCVAVPTVQPEGVTSRSVAFATLGFCDLSSDTYRSSLAFHGRPLTVGTQGDPPWSLPIQNLRAHPFLRMRPFFLKRAKPAGDRPRATFG